MGVVSWPADAGLLLAFGVFLAACGRRCVAVAFRCMFATDRVGPEASNGAVDGLGPVSVKERGEQGRGGDDESDVDFNYA